MGLLIVWYAADADKENRHEASMMKALANCPLCREHEPCLLDCRYGQKRSWKECLEECLKDSPMVMELMVKMSERHGGSSKSSTVAPEPLVKHIGGLQRGGAADTDEMETIALNADEM